MRTIHSAVASSFLLTLSATVASVALAASPEGAGVLKLDTWHQVSAGVYEKFNSTGVLERVELTGDVQPDAVHSQTGTMCVNPAGQAHNGYAYAFDAEFSNGLLGTTAIARAYVTTNPGGSSPAPTTTTVTSHAQVTNGFTLHQNDNSGGFSTIVTAIANFDFYPRPALCGASTYSKIVLKGGACSVETTMDYSSSSDCTD